MILITLAGVLLTVLAVGAASSLSMTGYAFLLIYTGMLLNGTLNSHLEEIDRQAEEMFDLLIEQMAAREGITEQLKADDQMAWVGKMNNIQSRAMEIVYNELIFA